MADKTFQCRLVTPQGKLLDAQASYANVPAHDGYIGFQANRAPIVFKLGKGELTVDAAGGAKTFKIAEGFGQMVENRLTILTTKADAGKA